MTSSITSDGYGNSSPNPEDDQVRVYRPLHSTNWMVIIPSNTSTNVDGGLLHFLTWKYGEKNVHRYSPFRIEVDLGSKSPEILEERVKEFMRNQTKGSPGEPPFMDYEPEREYFVDTFEDAVDSVLRDLKTVLISKRRDYGSRNLTAFGELGIMVRTYDKIERLRNLTLSGKEPENEAIDDTWVDIANYGILALILRRDQMDLPDSAPTPDPKPTPVNPLGMVVGVSTTGSASVMKQGRL